jgi:hypothetical protein
MISGILRLMGIGWMMIFGKMFIPQMRGWMGPGGGPFFGWSLDSVLSRGIFSAGIVLAFFGVVHLVLAWGLFERAPWARFLGLALGFQAGRCSVFHLAPRWGCTRCGCCCQRLPARSTSGWLSRAGKSTPRRFLPVRHSPPLRASVSVFQDASRRRTSENPAGA